MSSVPKKVLLLQKCIVIKLKCAVLNTELLEGEMFPQNSQTPPKMLRYGINYTLNTKFKPPYFLALPNITILE